MISDIKAGSDMPVKNSSGKHNSNIVNNIKFFKSNYISENKNRKKETTNKANKKDNQTRRITLINDYFPSLFKNKINEKNIIKNSDENNENTKRKETQEDNKRRRIQKKKPQYYQSNLHMNELPLANDRWGDPFIRHKEEDTIRLFYQNVNSIQCHSMDKWEESLNLIKDYKIDICGMSETSSNWSKTILKNRFVSRARSVNPHSSIEFSDNEYICKDNFLPGGTLQITTGPWNCRIISSIKDVSRMGRWSGSIYRLNSVTSLYVISAYRVCKQSVSNNNEASKSSTAYTQQHVLLRSKSSDPNYIPNPRLQFIEDLKNLIKKFKLRQTDHIIIMLDANEQIGDEQNGIVSLMNEFHLVDTILHHHNRILDSDNFKVTDEDDNQECNIATYNRGSKRIDYILSSRNTIPFIKKSGYLPFFEGIPSDHRGMFIDIDCSIYDPTLKLHIPPKRHIGSDCSRKIKEKYISYINKEFINQNIYRSIENLDKNHNKDSFAQELFNIDKKVIDIMIEAEKRSVIKTSRWSKNKDIHIARLVVKIWSTVFRGLKTNRDTSEQVSKLVKRCPKEIASQFAIIPKEQSYFLWNNAKQRLKYHKLEHKTKLEANLLKEMEFDSIESGIKTEKIYKNKNQLNNIKRTFNELKIILKSTKRSGISHIEVPYLDKNGIETNDPDSASSWKIINDPQTIEDYIIERNIKHFGQAQGTPFTSGNLADKLSYSGSSSICNDILNGSLNNDMLDIENPYAKLIMNKLSDKKCLKELDTNITCDEMRKGFIKWNERTSTSPSSKRHLGHIKVIVQIPKPKSEKKKKRDENEYDEEIIQTMTDINFMKEDIFKVIHFISNTAFNHGISLPRWKNVTTAMIEKIPGQPKINKLRVIHLYECDYNMMLKLLWARKLVWHSHDNNILNKGQSGSRPGHRALEVGLKKEMTYLYSRLSRTALATMDNDAKSCYDRIICNIAMLVSRYCGMSPEACKTQASTLEHTIFNLRTALGDSSKTYSHSKQKPIHGTGQGSCASPCIWLVLSSILMDCLQNNTKGMTIIDIIKNNAVFRQWIDGYVDDTALIANILSTCLSQLAQSTKELAENLKEIATMWNGLLEASGGKLELSKCFYYLLNWKFDVEGRYKAEDKCEQQKEIEAIKITDSTKKVTTIHQKDVFESHKTLGMFKNMIGDESDHLKYISTQSDQIISIIATTPLSRKHAKVAFSCIYVPKMIYSLPAFNFSEQQLDSFHKKAITTFISKIGFKRSFPRSMIFAPIKYGGLNLPFLYTETNIVKVMLLMSHCRANSQLGQILCTNLNWLQINTGLGTPLLYNTSAPINYVENNWFFGVRNFLKECNMKIYIDKLWFPIKERANDKILMEEFGKLELQKSKMKLLNIWRIYFKVSTLSDICDATGWKILPIYWIRPEQNIDFSHRISKLNWPIQTLPGPKGFQIWKSCLKTCFGIDEKGFLPFPLGMWSSSFESSNSIWDSYYDSNTDCVYKKVTNKAYKMYNVKDIKSNRTQHTFDNASDNKKDGTGIGNALQTSDVVDQPPKSAFPVDTVINNGLIQLITPIPVKKSNASYTTKLSTPFIEDKSEWEKMIRKNTIIFQQDPVKTLLEQKYVFAATDGSIKNNSNSFAAIISGENDSFFQTLGHIWSHHENPSPARSEILAILSALTCFRLLFEEENLPNQINFQLHIISDCLSMVNRINSHRVNILNKDMCLDEIDVELQVIHEINYLSNKGINVSIKHIKAHPNNKKKKKNNGSSTVNSIETELNTLADCLAKTAIDLPREELKYFHFAANKFELRDFHNNQITNNVKNYIREEFHLPKVRSHLMKTNSHSWNEDLSDTIWWSAHHSAISSYCSIEITRIQKYINNMLPTNHSESKYRYHIKDICISCNETNEDVKHILQCPCANRRRIREEFLGDLSIKLKYETCKIETIISNATSAWLSKSPIPELDRDTPLQILDAYDSQSKLGWDNFLKGKLSLQWKKIINMNEKNAEKWGQMIITTNFQFFLNCWEQRKQDIYGGNDLDNSNIDTIDLREQAIYLLNQNTTVAKCDESYINITNEEIFQMNSNTLRAWIYNFNILSQAFQRQNDAIKTKYDNSLAEETTKKIKTSKSEIKNKK